MDAVIQSLVKILPNAFGTFEAFVEGTLAAAIAILWVLVVAIQLARPYILRTLKKFSLRVGADLWWLIYAGMRDLILAITFVMSTMYLMPDILSGQPLSITGPLATALLFGALTIKLGRDADGDENAFATESRLLALGAGVYLAPYLLVHGLGGFWTHGFDWLLTTTNATAFAGMSVPAFVIWAGSTLAVIVMSVRAVLYALRDTRTPVAAQRPAAGD